MPLPNGAAIKALRQDQKWKGAHFALAVGISHGHLFNIEAGRKRASQELLERIAVKLDVSIDDVVAQDQLASPVPATVSGQAA